MGVQTTDNASDLQVKTVYLYVYSELPVESFGKAQSRTIENGYRFRVRLNSDKNGFDNFCRNKSYFAKQNDIKSLIKLFRTIDEKNQSHSKISVFFTSYPKFAKTVVGG